VQALEVENNMRKRLKVMADAFIISLQCLIESMMSLARREGVVVRKVFLIIDEPMLL